MVTEEPMPERADEVAALLVQVYEMHEVIIAETGGLPGLRDAAMLHAAVARPFATLGSQERYPTDFEKAAALFIPSSKAIRLWTEPNAPHSRRRFTFLSAAVILFPRSSRVKT